MNTRRSPGLIALLSLSVAGISYAQDPLSPQITTEDSLAQEEDRPLTPEEKAEIEAALETDASEAEERQLESGGLPTQAATGGGSGVSMNPEISAILDFAVAGFSEPVDERLPRGAHDPNNNGFNLQQFELAIGAVVDPYFRFDSYLIFSLFSVEIEEAYGTTLALPFGLQARGGQYLAPFGYINTTHPHQWAFVDQPFMETRYMGPEQDRGLGMEFSWLTPLPWYVLLLGSSQMADEARSFLNGDDRPVTKPLDLQYVAAIRQFFELSNDWSLKLDLSGAWGPNTTSPDNITGLYNAYAYLKYRPITRQSHMAVAFRSEWTYSYRQVPDNALTSWAGYAQLEWQFARRWQTAARFEFGTPEQTTDSGTVPRPFYLDPEWTADRQRYSAALTFFPSEFSRLRIQGEADTPQWQSSVGWAGFFAVELIAGAHGAHQY